MHLNFSNLTDACHWEISGLAQQSCGLFFIFCQALQERKLHLW